MAHRLTFDTADATHHRHYELAHVIMLTTRVALSPAEQNRLGELQDEWESLGRQHPDEMVINDRQFSAARFLLADCSPPVKHLVLEDAVHELLVRLCKESTLSGHVARPRRALVAFLEASDRGRLTTDGFVANGAAAPLAAPPAPRTISGLAATTNAPNAAPEPITMEIDA